MNRTVSLSMVILMFPLFWTPPAGAQTQQEMNVDYYQKYLKLDNELKERYQELLDARRDDALFTQKLKQSQQAWIAFRDAQIEAIWPESDKPTHYGSIWPVCQSQALAEMTLTRISQLKRMLHGNEGDVCAWGE